MAVHLSLVISSGSCDSPGVSHPEQIGSWDGTVYSAAPSANGAECECFHTNLCCIEFGSQISDPVPRSMRVTLLDLCLPRGQARFYHEWTPGSVHRLCNSQRLTAHQDVSLMKKSVSPLA
ncbi:hypothetical protein PoB_004960700 [Plakobranchus ocellatus]|uniref:DUF4773 domain-containing protein n=1 Tax=Plakobranchus ocellatus TaxID=259542 RepID=A0AAV4BVN1_9GAST|nr:hypothetical protein PoB_004960700 [Plakobranchus ocellatus]